MRHGRAGFTLIELTAVIGVIAILAAILFPVFSKARERARTTSCASNLAEIGMALRMYAEDAGGRYPPRGSDLAPIARRVGTVAVFVCPSSPSTAPTPAEQRWLDKAKRIETLGQAPSYFFSPVIADGRLIGSHYYYRAGFTNEAWGKEMLAADRAPRHSDGANVLYASGTVRWVRQEIWAALVPPEARVSMEDQPYYPPPPSPSPPTAPSGSAPPPPPLQIPGGP